MTFLKALATQKSDLLMLISLSVVCAAVWSRALTPAQDEEWVDRHSASPTDTEVLIVLIGSSTCSASRAEWMPDLMDDMRDSMTLRGIEAGFNAVFVGVALDRRHEEGLSFLRKLGPFDEIIVGRSWMNTGSVAYMIRDQAGETAIPQVVVFRRTVAVDDDWRFVSPDQLLDRRVGLDEIKAWADLGFPIRMNDFRSAMSVSP